MKKLRWQLIDSIAIPLDLSRSEWLERPSIAYQQVFDICTLDTRQANGHFIILASSQFYARELLKRLNGEVLLVPLGDWYPQLADISMQLDLRSNLRIIQEKDLGSLSNSNFSYTVLWAEPEVNSWERIVESILGFYSSIDSLIIIGTTTFRGVLPEWKVPKLAPACDPLNSINRIKHELGHQGFKIKKMIGVYGLQSLFWGAFSRLPALFDRLDIVDRCFIAVRNNLIVSGWQAKYSSIWLLRMEPSR